MKGIIPVSYTHLSRDHDFEAGFCLWIPDRLEHELEFKLSRAYGKLPEEYLGVRREKQSLLGGGRRGVLLTGEFYRRFTGRPGAPESLMEWLYTPEPVSYTHLDVYKRQELNQAEKVKSSLQEAKYKWQVPVYTDIHTLSLIHIS